MRVVHCAALDVAAVFLSELSVAGAARLTNDALQSGATTHVATAMVHTFASSASLLGLMPSINMAKFQPTLGHATTCC